MARGRKSKRGRKPTQAPSKRAKEVLLTDLVNHIGEKNYRQLQSAVSEILFNYDLADPTTRHALYLDPDFREELAVLHEHAIAAARSIDITPLMNELINTNGRTELWRTLTYNDQIPRIITGTSDDINLANNILINNVVKPLNSILFLRLMTEFDRRRNAGELGRKANMNFLKTLSSRTNRLKAEQRTTEAINISFLDLMNAYELLGLAIPTLAVPANRFLLLALMGIHSSNPKEVTPARLAGLDELRKNKAKHYSEWTEEISPIDKGTITRIRIQTLDTDRTAPPVIANINYRIINNNDPEMVSGKRHICTLKLTITETGELYVGNSSIPMADYFDPDLYPIIREQALQALEAHLAAAPTITYESSPKQTAAEINKEIAEVLQQRDPEGNIMWPAQAIDIFGAENLAELNQLTRDERLAFVDQLSTDDILSREEAPEYAALFPEYQEYRLAYRKLADQFLATAKPQITAITEAYDQNPTKAATQICNLLSLTTEIGMALADIGQSTHKNAIIFHDFINPLSELLFEPLIARVQSKKTDTDNTLARKYQLQLAISNHLKAPNLATQVVNCSQVRRNLKNERIGESFEQLPASTKPDSLPPNLQQLIEASLTHDSTVSNHELELENSKPAELKIISFPENHHNEVCYGYISFPKSLAGSFRKDQSETLQRLPFAIDRCTGEINVTGTRISYSTHLEPESYQRFKDLVYELAAEHFNISPTKKISLETEDIQLLQIETKASAKETVALPVDPQDFAETYQYQPYTTPSTPVQAKPTEDLESDTIELSDLSGYTLPRLEKALEAHGILFHRAGKGSHMIYKGPNNLPLPIPKHGDVSAPILKKNLKMWGVSLRAFVNTLKKR